VGQKNLGKQIWGFVSPIIVYYIALWIVQFVATGYFLVQHIEEVQALTGTPEQVSYAALEIIYDDLLASTVIMMAAAAALSLPVLSFMMKRDRIQELVAGILPNSKAPLSKYALIVGISAPFALGLNNLILLSDLAAYSEIYQETAQTFYSNDFLVQLICLGIISPIAEEFIFRGLIYKRIRRNTKTPVRAMVYSGLAFGFYHGNLVQTIYGCLSGFLLAYIYEKYGSLKAPILAHVVMNLVALVLTEVNVFVWMFEDILRMGIITAACATLASTMYLFIKKIDEKPLKCEAE
jgi:membrane protease YdiL (CAAX protease family)